MTHVQKNGKYIFYLQARTKKSVTKKAKYFTKLYWQRQILDSLLICAKLFLQNNFFAQQKK